ncbi:MAG: C4-type zinc ribbon domain-containing protein [Chloroflexi bacterium]|nr:C4-type zinc ribbon domain-containing protein [Chloroflexota bacterium]MDA1272368.1 C4-type zinc ribbon domain-containing protein [Chloroflexota bacterium]
MTTVRQMFALQELDIILDRVQSEHDKIKYELSNGNTIVQLESDIERDAELLIKSELQQRATKLDVETQRERSETLNSQLYGGEITNPRDLENLEREAQNVRKLLEQHETALSKISERIEEIQNRKSELETRLSDARAAWEVRQAELQATIKGLDDERSGFVDQRTKLTESLDPTSLQHYESLRKTKGGLAIVKVERGLCQGCRMSLPTHQQQRVRNGRQTVLCSSCGRMLFLS